MSPTLEPMQWGSFLAHWHLRPLWLEFSLLALVVYVGAVAVTCRHGARVVHPARVVSFVAGIAVLLFTVSSAIDTYAMSLFWYHMVEHLLMIMVVPGLLVMGHPISALRGLAESHGRVGSVDAFARSWLVSVITHPVVGFGLYAAVIVATHLTGFMDAMAGHRWLTGAEPWLYLVTGYIYLLPLLGAEPIRRQVPYVGRLALVLLGMTPDTIVGIVLLQTTYNMFPAMEAGHPTWAPDPVHDLHLGGALMWVGGDALMMLFAVGVTIALISHPASPSILGQRLEGARRRTLAEHVARSGEAAPVADDGDVDEDEAMLEAYNRMLARMSGRTADPPPRE